jgi:uncharacterized protein
VAGPSETDDVRVADNPSARRYEMHVGSKLAGHLRYALLPGRIVLIHTEIDPAFEGLGLGTVLAEQVLGDVRARGLTVDPQCPFIAEFIQRNPRYADLVTSATDR